jgi:hypothetical protein
VSKRQRPKDRERFGKKYYDGKGLRCATCDKHSHEESWCPAAQVRPEDPALRCAWADQLIDGERVRVEVYEGLTREDAIARFDSQGAEFNKGNPAAVEAGGQATLKSRLGYWKALGADRVVLSWVWYGVPMPFAEPPPREHWANAKSAVQHAEFVDKTIAEQVALGNFVEVAPEFAEVIHPLMVEVNGKKPRMCVNMIPTNSFLAGQPFRQEMLAKVGLDVVRPDSHLLVADLKSAYYSVQMRQEALPWNCFMWEGKCYSARSLLFGNSLGPWFFTKLGRPILGFLRTIGVSCTAYVDDFLGAVDPADSAAVGPQLEKLLQDLGWTVSPKSELVGATTKTFTGFIINTEAMTYTVSQAKIDKLLALVEQALAFGASAVPYKLLQRIEGNLGAMQLAVRPALLYVRSVAMARASGNETQGVFLTEDQRQDLADIPGLIERHNGADIRPTRADVFAHGDAGGIGVGARVFAQRFEGEGGASTTLAEPLTEAEMHGSSTLRELTMALRLLQARGKEWVGKKVCLFFDSKNAVRNILKGGSTASVEQLEVCKQISKVCAELHIVLQPEWIPREDNTVSDGLSKIYDNGALRACTKAKVQAKFGAKEVIVPGFNDATRGVVAAARAHKEFVVVVPEWRTQPWWANLRQLAKAAGRQPLKLGSYKRVFDMAARKWHKIPHWPMVALLVKAKDVRKMFD